MKAILYMYDNCSENVEVGVGDYVVANTDDFGLKKGEKYKILEVNSYDLITVEVYKGHTDEYSIEYFDEYIIEKQDLVKRICNRWSHINITEEQTLAIADFIEKEIEERYIINFIEDDLSVFRDKKDAFNWFFDDEEIGCISIDSIDLVITEDMIGKNFKDIILEGKENYKEVAGLYLTWWL